MTSFLTRGHCLKDFSSRNLGEFPTGSCEADRKSSGSSNAATVEVGRRKSVQILKQELVKDETLMYICIYTIDIISTSAIMICQTIFLE